MKLNEKKSAKNQKDKRKHSGVLRAFACTSLATLLLVFVCVPSFAMSSTVIGDINSPYLHHYSSQLPIDSVYTAMYSSDSGADPYTAQPAYYSDFENNIYTSVGVTNAINQESRFVVNRSGNYPVRSFVNRITYLASTAKVSNTVYFGDSSYIYVPGYMTANPIGLDYYHLGFSFAPFTYNYDFYRNLTDVITIRYNRPASLGDERIGVTMNVRYTATYSDGRVDVCNDFVTAILDNGYFNNESASANYTLTINPHTLLPSPSLPVDEIDDRCVISDFSVYISNDFHNYNSYNAYDEGITLSSFTYQYSPTEYNEVGIVVEDLPYEDISYPTYLSNDFNLLSWVRNVLNEIFELPIFTTSSGLTVVTLGTVVGTVVTIVFAVVILKMFYGG